MQATPKLQGILAFSVGLTIGLLLRGMDGSDDTAAIGVAGGRPMEEPPPPTQVNCHCNCPSDDGRSFLGSYTPEGGRGPGLLPRPGKPDAASASGRHVSMTLDGLMAHAEAVQGRIQATRDAMGTPQSCDVGPNDAVALLTATDLMKVDVILESGTAGGRSTELMARFFQGTGVQITTVDVGRRDIGGRCSAKVADTHQRLKAFPNVRALIGDSSVVFPELVQENRGKRIGLFIDGPKGLPAVTLCMNMLKLSADVEYCLFHDVLPPTTGRKTESEIYTFLQTWGRTVTTTCCADRWLRHFGLEHGRNSSIGIVAGTRSLPLGVKGDF